MMASHITMKNLLYQQPISGSSVDSVKMIRIILFSHDGILMNNGDGDDDDPGDTDKYHEYHDPNEYHDGDDPDDQELLRPGGLSVFLPDLSLFSRPPHPPHTLLPSITLGNLTCNILLKIKFSKSSLFQSNPRIAVFGKPSQVLHG